MAIQITPIPCLADNYSYLLVCPATQEAVVVDPADYGSVEDVVREAKVRLVAVLATHHHADHTGGNLGLLRHHPGLHVVAHASEKGRLGDLTHPLESGGIYRFGRQEVRALYTPGHTNGSVCYGVEEALFTGDTLFGAGCGRLFEGSPATLYHSLNRVLASLPDTIRIFFGHEYTESNLRFALHIEPDNPEVKARLEQAQQSRRQGRPTTPSHLGLERKTNPFLRCQAASVRESAALAGKLSSAARAGDSPVEVFAALRALKDHF